MSAIWAPLVVAVNPVYEAVFTEDVAAWRSNWTRGLVAADDAVVVD